MNKLEQWYANTTKMQKVVLWGVAILLFLFSLAVESEILVASAFLFIGFLLYLYFGKKKFENKNNNEE